MVSNITNKLQIYFFFSHNCLWICYFSHLEVHLHGVFLSKYFLLFLSLSNQILVLQTRIQRRPLPNPTGRLSSIVYSIHVPASWAFAFLITRHRVLKENGFLSCMSSYLASNQRLIFILLCWNVIFCIPGCFKTWNNPTAQTSNCRNHQAKIQLMRNNKLNCYKSTRR